LDPAFRNKKDALVFNNSSMQPKDLVSFDKCKAYTVINRTGLLHWQANGGWCADQP